ncbi:MAG: RDD family protein [Micrococcales bacterium]
MTSDAANSNWAGQRLGLPKAGTNSLAKMGRRILALCVDWAAAMLVSYAFFKYDNIATLIIFAVEQTLLVATAQASLGHRICGLKVIRLDSKPVGIYRAFIRAALLTIVIPVAIWDSDNRGLHDKAAGTALVLR